MTINPASISTVDYSQSFAGQITILRGEPDPEATLDPPLLPLQLVGYWDSITDTVRLYVADETGERLVRIG
jgi:hypothetical protein